MNFNDTESLVSFCSRSYPVFLKRASASSSREAAGFCSCLFNFNTFDFVFRVKNGQAFSFSLLITSSALGSLH